MTGEQERAFLELISTVRLYDEFKRRFEHVIISGLSKRPTQDDPEHFVLSYAYIGDPLRCQGLALQIIARCQRDLEETAEDMDLHEL